MPVYKNPDFRELSGGLATIFDGDCRQSFFGLSQWYDLLTRLGLPQESEVRVYTDERADSASALLFQATNRQGRRCVSSLANFYSIEHGPIAAPGADLDRGFAGIVREITTERPRWDCLKIADLDPAEDSYEALLRALRYAGFLVECTSGAATWFEVTDGMSFTEYLAQRPSQLRNTWQRRRRSAKAAGRLSAVFFADAADVDAAITDYQTVYGNSWKPPEAFARFIPALIRLAAELGALRLGIYYVDGMPAAAQFWIIWHRRAAIYKLAHDRRFDKLSLGTLLTMDMLERVLEQDRPAEINFGRGDDPYKRLWLPKRRERWGIMAANPLTLAGLRFGIERQTAKLFHRLRGEPVAPRVVQASVDHMR